MILVNTVSQLQQNNLKYRENLYFEPIVKASDIFFQGFLPKQLQNNYSLEVHLMSYQGDEFIADITNDFEAVFAVSIYNKNYFTLRLKQFSPIFEGHRYFCFKIIVRNAGFIIFTRITEPYQRFLTGTTCYAVIDDFAMMIVNKAGYIKINNSVFQFGQGLHEAGYELDYIDGNYYLYVDCNDIIQIGYCYRGEDYLIDVPLTATTFIVDGCQLPHIRLEATYNCEDSVTGDYYGDPKTLLNYSQNNPSLRFRKTIYIPGEITVSPTEIKKNVSFLGKPQRSEYVRKFELTGLDVFPEWKMLEIEAMFSGRRIFINGIEYVYRGGKIFIKDDIPGTGSWKLKAELEDFPKVNDFSCIDDCSTFCYFFVIPAGDKDQTYYGEERQPIAYTYQGLIDYFTGLSDTVSVTDFDTDILWCDVTAIIKIDTFGTVPSFIYYKLPLEEYRIFAKYDDCANPVKLCEGMSGCKRPSNVSSIFSEYIGCAPAPSKITSRTEKLGDYLEFGYEQVYNEWTIISYSFRKYTTFIEIKFVVENINISDSTTLTNEPILKLETIGVPNNYVYENYGNAQFEINPNGDISASGNTTNNKLELTTIYNI
ncbi:hypothetical protein EGI16_03460 [Chryseobacterium sp. G0240]|uniref:hypothetical protein n=1 Tax=Chryseobacterium sp. G0240 TaxID=2487066 RepID=UPI000F44F98F|nr:hypothetical protein [Chryseobacterium sp. G0240]ROI05457.1 hypothetical protein EGI16_03460 [Chryseobacterium sp. G0240]